MDLEKFLQFTTNISFRATSHQTYFLQYIDRKIQLKTSYTFQLLQLRRYLPCYLKHSILYPICSTVDYELIVHSTYPNTLEPQLSKKNFYPRHVEITSVHDFLKNFLKKIVYFLGKWSYNRINNRVNRPKKLIKKIFLKKGIFKKTLNII